MLSMRISLVQTLRSEDTSRRARSWFPYDQGLFPYFSVLLT